MISHCWNA